MTDRFIGVNVLSSTENGLSARLKSTRGDLMSDAIDTINFLIDT